MKYYKLYSSWLTFLTDCNKTGTYQDQIRLSQDKNSGEWSGFKDFHSALETAIFGWHNGTKAMKKAMKEIKKFIPIVIAKQNYEEELTFDIVGETLDLGKFLEGDPDCMGSYQPGFSKLIDGDRLQRIYVNVVYSNSITSETLFNYGASVLSIIDQFELAGYRQELIARVCIYPKGRPETAEDQITIDVVVKQFEDPLDYSKLSFVFGNPGYLRRLIFAILEQYDEPIINQYEFKSNGSYGHPKDYKEDLQQNDIYIGMQVNNAKGSVIAQDITTKFNEKMKPTSEDQSNNI